MERPAHNPYAPPVADVGAAELGGELEASRRAHITVETNIRSLGALVLFGGVLNLIIGVSAFGSDPIQAVVALVIAGLAFAAGVKLRGLDPLGRVLYTVIAVLAVLRSGVELYLLSNAPKAPPGAGPATMLPLIVIGLFLALLWGKKGTVVFSEHYRNVVIPATPHVKYKTSRVAIAILAILLVVLVALVVAAII